MTQLIAGAEDKKYINPFWAWASIIAVALLFFAGFYGIGQLFFWGTFNNSTLAHRQLEVAKLRLQEDPYKPANYVNLGFAYLKNKNYHQALAQFNKAIDMDENYYPAYLNLGLTYMQLNKFEVASEVFNKAISLDSKSPGPHLNLGLCYLKTGKYQEALGEFQLAEKLNPASVEIIYQQGVAYEKLGRYREAEFQYRSSLSFDPKYKEALQGLKRLKTITKAAGDYK